jgi:hypothetical protein
MSVPFPPNPHNFGLPPRTAPVHSGPEAMVCTRCDHRARTHSGSGSCTARVRWRWWRHCKCGSYTGFDAADPA